MPENMFHKLNYSYQILCDEPLTIYGNILKELSNNLIRVNIMTCHLNLNLETRFTCHIFKEQSGYAIVLQAMCEGRIPQASLKFNNPCLG